MKIFKYQLGVTDHQEIQMPRGARILCVQVQGEGGLNGVILVAGHPCIWAAVDEARPLVKRKFLMAPTGGDVSMAFNSDGGLFKRDTFYVGTVQMMDGKLVFHVFDLGEAP